MEFEEINPNVWKPENEGDTVEGVVIRKQKNVGINESNAYHLENKGTQVMVWGATVLDNRMEYVNVGEFVRITYKGKNKNSKGQDVKLFKVERRLPEQPVKEEKVEAEQSAS